MGLAGPLVCFPNCRFKRPYMSEWLQMSAPHDVCKCSQQQHEDQSWWCVKLFCSHIFMNVFFFIAQYKITGFYVSQRWCSCCKCISSLVWNGLHFSRFLLSISNCPLSKNSPADCYWDTEIDTRFLCLPFPVLLKGKNEHMFLMRQMEVWSRVGSLDWFIISPKLAGGTFFQPQWHDWKRQKKQVASLANQDTHFPGNTALFWEKLSGGLKEKWTPATSLITPC